MRLRLGSALLIFAGLLLSGCGVAKRAALHGLVAIQSNAVLTQSTFKDPHEGGRRHKPCDGMRSARLNFADAFSQAMTSVNSTMASSSKCRWARANSSSGTSRPVIVMLSAYSSAMRSTSLKSAEVAYASRARSFSSGTPSSLPTAALRSCQNSQPLRKATRRLIIVCNDGSMSPELSMPLHIARAPRKSDGRRA